MPNPLCSIKIPDRGIHPVYLCISKFWIYRERDDALDQVLRHRKALFRYANEFRVALLTVNRHGVMYPTADTMTGQVLYQGVAFIARNDIKMINVRTSLAHCWKGEW
jgi:hypothetical protein